MKRTVVPMGVFLLLMAAYLWTMAPGNFWLDSAAFSTCNEILGLPHSPSFPLYTVAGRTLHMSMPVEPARASNLFSALAAAMAGVVCYYVLMNLFNNRGKPLIVAHVVAATGALYICLLVPVWQSAVRAEIYALQIVLTAIMLYLFIRATDDPPRIRQISDTVLMVFLQGIAFANHSLLALATLPLVIMTIWRVRRSAPGKNFIMVLLAGSAVFIVALSAYLYLPIRASQNPAINSGRPTTAASTFQAITRTGEGYLPATGDKSIDYPGRVRRLGEFAVEQVGGLVLFGIVVAAYMAIKKRMWVIAGIIVSALTGLMVTVWSADFRLINFDIVAYSAVGLILFTVCGFYGLYLLFERFDNRRRLNYIAYIVCGLLIFFQFSGNLYSSDLSGVRGPDKLAAAILDDAPDDAILLVNEDNVLLPLWYRRFALGIRPDVAILSTGGLYRPSYRDEIRHVYPGLAMPDEFNSYRIDNLGAALHSFCLSNDDRPVLVQFGTPGIETERLAPAGFLFRYGPDTVQPTAEDAEKLTALLDAISAGTTDPLTREFVARSAFNFGVYFDRFGQLRPAYRFFKYAIETDDTNPDYFLKLGVAFLKAGKIEQAVILLEQATNTGPGCPQAEELLREIYRKEFTRR